MEYPVTQPDELQPGTIVRFDFEIVGTDQKRMDETIHELKQAVWADEWFDYQGSRVETVDGVKMLRVWASARKTAKVPRPAIDYPSLSLFEAYVRASVIVFGDMVRWVKTETLAFVTGIRDMAMATAKALPTLSVGFVLLALVVAYWFFFGVPKRGK